MENYKIGQKILVRPPIDIHWLSKDKIYTGTIVKPVDYADPDHIPFKIEGTNIEYAILHHCAHINYNDWIVVVPNTNLLTNITKFLRRIIHA